MERIKRPIGGRWEVETDRKTTDLMIPRQILYENIWQMLTSNDRRPSLISIAFLYWVRGICISSMNLLHPSFTVVFGRCSLFIPWLLLISLVSFGTAGFVSLDENISTIYQYCNCITGRRRYSWQLNRWVENNCKNKLHRKHNILWVYCFVFIMKS